MSTKKEERSLRDPEKRSELFDQWVRIMNKIVRSESLPSDFGTGDLLFASEMHALSAIGKAPGINITDLSALLGVTKGAISKMTRRVEEKGLIERYQVPGNEKEIRLRLTKKGEMAYHGHQDQHAKTFARLFSEMEKLSDTQIVFLFDVFSFIEEMMDEALREKGDGTP